MSESTHNSHRDKDPSRSKHKHRDRSSERDDGSRTKHRHRDREETEEERKERKRAKRDKEDRKGGDRESDKKRHKARKREDGGLGVVDDDAGMWVEKGVEESATSVIPSSDSLPLRSDPSDPSVPLPPTTASTTYTAERGSWMLQPDVSLPPKSAPDSDIPHSATIQTSSKVPDFFDSFGTEHKRKDYNDSKPDPSKVGVDYRELNTQLKEGKHLDEYETTEKKKTGAGGAGWQFRMRKLARLQEQAQEMGRPVEEVALERYGNIDEYLEAVEERRVLDERDSRRLSRRGTSGTPVPSAPSTPGMRTPGDGRRYMFTPNGEDFSRPGSRAGFRRPGDTDDTPAGGRLDQLRRTESIRPTPKGDKTSTPIPSVFTPQLQRSNSGYPFPSDTTSLPPLSLADLNRLQAKVLRAKLTDAPDVDHLEEEYEFERMRYEASTAEAGLYSGNGEIGRRTEGDKEVVTQVLPTLDGAGRLYDVGLGEGGEEKRGPGNKRKKVEKFETRDKQGNLLRYNADDDSQSLGELVRQERFGAGSAEQKSLDAAMAGAIAGDTRYQDDLDYMDENAERLARRKMKSDAMKRQFAINDFARTKRALDSCAFCYQEERNPLTAVVALGTRVYLCCTMTEELVPGHCLIAPIQHHLSTLELEDDDWEEIRNFMKCLMRMFAKENKGVIFFETIPSFRQQRHTYIEAVPAPFEQFQDCPAYFRESILASESEWSQHKKLIDFSTRPGGFRRSLVANLPYFMVQWDYKGEKGYGHIIEGDEENAGKGMDEGEGGVYEGDKGTSGGFPPYFAAEVIGNILGLEPRKWMKPKKLDYSLNHQRAKTLGTKFQPYNWTLELQG